MPVAMMEGRIKRFAVPLLLLLFAVQAGYGLLTDSAVCDEIGAHIPSGWVFLSTGVFSGGMGNPPLVQALIATPMKLAGLTYQIGTEQHLGLFRLPILLLGLLLGYFIYRFARSLYGERGGLLSLFLFAFSPNFIAHSHLATLDLGVTCFMFLTVYAFYRFAGRPSWWQLLCFLLAFALAQLSKFTALLLIPILGLIALSLLGAPREAAMFKWLPGSGRLRGLFKRRSLGLVQMGALVVLLSILLVNVAYQFQGTGEEKTDALTIALAPQNPTEEEKREAESSAAMSMLGPLSRLFPYSFVTGVVGKNQHQKAGHFSFLNGERSLKGWWSYFFWVILWKTPITTLLLFVSGILLWRQRESDAGRDGPFVFIPIILLLGYFSFINRVDIGLRHVLPVYPFLLVAAGSAAKITSRRIGRLAMVLFCFLHLVAAVKIFPHHLSYFNLLAGGPANGHKRLIDSNIDWGQDDHRLRRWVERSDVPVQVNPDPYTPVTGRVAVNVNRLQGIFQFHRDSYRWLRYFEPRHPAGYCWNVYDLTDEDYETLLEANPGDPKVLETLALFFLNKGSRGDLVRAEGLARSAVAAAPADLPLRLTLARVFIAREKYGLAWQVSGPVRDFYELDPENRSSWYRYNAGIIYLESAARAELQVRPESEAANALMAQVLLQQGDEEGALRHLETATASDSVGMGTIQTLFRYYMVTAEFEKAVEVYRGLKDQLGDGFMAEQVTDLTRAEGFARNAKGRGAVGCFALGRYFYREAQRVRNPELYRRTKTYLDCAVEQKPEWGALLESYGEYLVQMKLGTVPRE